MDLVNDQENFHRADIVLKSLHSPSFAKRSLHNVLLIHAFHLKQLLMVCVIEHPLKARVDNLNRIQI